MALQTGNRWMAALPLAAASLVLCGAGCGRTRTQVEPASGCRISDDASVSLVAFVAAEGVDSETMRQVMQQLSSECPEPVRLRTIDAQSSPGWKRNYQLETLPTILLLHRGREIRRWRGARDRHLLRTAVDEALGRFEPTGPVAITVPILPGPQDAPAPSPLAAETGDSVQIED